MIRILLADDHLIVRRGLREILLEGFPKSTVIEVSDGESLIKKVMDDVFDVIISDLLMPGRSGLEALEQIKKIKPKIPVLIISIHSEEQYALRALRAGAAAYLKKDMAPEELIDAIKIVLKGQRYITPAVAEKLTRLIDEKHNREPHEILSDREFDVFRMIAAGKSLSEIAQILCVSTSAVSTYRSRILTKMNMKTNADLAIYAASRSLFQ